MKLWLKAVGIVLGIGAGVVGSIVLIVWLAITNPDAAAGVVVGIIVLVIIGVVVVAVHSNLADRERARHAKAVRPPVGMSGGSDAAGARYNAAASERQTRIYRPGDPLD